MKHHTNVNRTRPLMGALLRAIRALGDPGSVSGAAERAAVQRAYDALGSALDERIAAAEAMRARRAARSR